MRDSGSRCCYCLRSPVARSPAQTPSGIHPCRRRRCATRRGYVASAEANFAAGIDADTAGDPVAIDYFYAAATESWPLHAANAAAPDRRRLRALSRQRAKIARRRRSLRPLRLGTGHHARRRLSKCPYAISASSGRAPTFTAFSRWAPMPRANCRGGTRRAASASSTSCSPAKCRGDRSSGSKQPFAATAVLQPATAPIGSAFTLDFYDPLRTAATDTGLPLARDLTAPIAYAATQEGDAWLEDFLDPADNDAGASLRMIDPYQPGKIPDRARARPGVESDHLVTS